MAKERGWWTFEANVELDEFDLEHIAGRIREGFTSGEVCVTTDAGYTRVRAGDLRVGDHHAQLGLVDATSADPIHDDQMVWIGWSGGTFGWVGTGTLFTVRRKS